MKEFYPAFFPQFVHVFVGSAILALSPLAVLSGFSIHASGYVVLTLLCAALAALWTLAMMKMFRLRVGAEEISATDVWGLRRSLKWEDIKSTSPFRFVGLEYLRLFPSDGSRPLWLPTFIMKRAAFLAAVTEAAPASNSVLIHFASDDAV